MTETEIKEKNEQIPIALKLQKWDEVFYVVRDLEKFYFENFYIKKDRKKLDCFIINYDNNIKTYYIDFNNLEISIWLNFHNLKEIEKKLENNYKLLYSDNKIEIDKIKKPEFPLSWNWSFSQKNYSVYEFEETFREKLPNIISNFDWTVSYITLNKIIHPFIFWNNTKLNEWLLKLLDSDFKDIKKWLDIIPIFFIEWWTYHLIDKDFKIIESKSIKWWDLHIWNTKIFDKKNLDVVFYPSYWLKKDFLNAMFQKIDYWLNSNNQKSTIKKEEKNHWKYFYTDEEILKEITKTLSALENNIHKEFSIQTEEKYIHQIKNLTPKTIIDFYNKTAWKLENIWNQKIISEDVRESIDNETNRALKVLLKNLKQNLNNEKSIIRSEDIKKKLISRINRFLQTYLYEVADIHDFEITHKFVYDIYYWKIHKLYKKLFTDLILSFNLINKHESDFMKSVNDIFEIYSYLELKDILDDVLKDIWYETKDDFKNCFYYENEDKNKNDILKYENKYDWISNFKEVKYKDKKCYLEYENNENKIRYIFWDILTHNFNKKRLDYINNRDSFNNFKDHNFQNILWESFKMWSEKLTPDISIDIYEKKGKKLKKKIIFDSKFSVFRYWDLEYPNPHYFKEELHKYRKIYDKNISWEFKSFIDTIFILYPWNISEKDLVQFNSLNNTIKSSYNMLLIPIYLNQDEKVKNYIKTILKNELENLEKQNLNNKY